MQEEIEELYFKSGGLKLFGRYFPASGSELCVTFLHGGGHSNSYRYSFLQRKLQEKGFASFSFDFRGCGRSRGSFEDGSLKNRLQDAINAIEFISQHSAVDPENMVISGGSMGGHIACRLLDYFDFRAIILHAAAAYSGKSESAKLNGEFSQIIRTENSWKDSPAFTSLGNYKGGMIALYGESDDVIPEGVKTKYKELVGKENFIILKGGKHRLLSPENSEEQNALNKMSEEILQFVKAF